jgi:class 3 adenylate cyclase/tetratricopeptide (TPR) repeat protein
VLFVDAVDSTSLAERLGEEEMYALMQRCLARMTETVHRFEGHVAHFAGDGGMAIFGAPIAHEDSARQAVAAALQMQRALQDCSAEVQDRHGIDCLFRVGLNTGPVVVGTISDDLTMDFTAVGDTVNLAARMQQLADPGAVLVSEHTHRVVGDFFECEPLGALVAKGKAEPVNAYRVAREKPSRTRLEVASQRGLAAFVGRSGELAALETYVRQARHGHGQVVLLSGEAGMGKSRLLLEFRRRLAGQPVTWLEGHCISYGKDISYLPMIELVKRVVGVEEGDGDARIIERVDEATAAWGLTGQAAVPYLKFLLAVDPGDPAVLTMDPRKRRPEILDALRALVVEQAARQPLVVVVEDLHWVDEMSRGALAALVDVVAAAPVLLVLTYRPGYEHGLGERTYVTRLSLGHLTDEESGALAADVLRATALPEALERLITSKAEGNPFYVEEETKSLLEMGLLVETNGSFALVRPVEEIRIPDTIQEVILSRIDRLEHRARQAIQLASVIGREFTVRLLDRISDIETRLDDALSELKALELIYEKLFSPELAYMFKHALTHDVAYSTLLHERRRALHRVVGAAIEELYADRLPEQYEALAHHYSEAQDWEKALDYLTKAGDKAAAAYANQDALAFYGRGLDACEKLGGRLETAAALAHRRGLVNFGIGNFSGAVVDFERKRGLAAALGDRSLEGMALAHRGMAEWFNHELDTAEVTFRASLRVADEGADQCRALASLLLGLIYIAVGRRAESGPLLAVVEQDETRLDEVGQGLWSWLEGRVESWAGRFDEALGKLERGRPFAEASMANLVWHMWNEALALGGRGDYQAALARLDETSATCERVGDIIVWLRVLNTYGWVYRELQDDRRALEWNRRCLEEVRATDMPPMAEIETHAVLNIAENLLALGRLDEAEEHFRQVEEVVRHPQPYQLWVHWRFSERFFHSFGELCLARGEADEALSSADTCIELAGDNGSMKVIVKGRRLRAEALIALGHLDMAEEELGIALQLARQVGNPAQLWKTLAALGQLRLAQQKVKDACQAYRDALAVIDEVALGLTDESLQAAFLASADVQAIRRAASG